MPIPTRFSHPLTECTTITHRPIHLFHSRRGIARNSTAGITSPMIFTEEIAFRGPISMRRRSGILGLKKENRFSGSCTDRSCNCRGSRDFGALSPQSPQHSLMKSPDRSGQSTTSISALSPIIVALQCMIAPLCLAAIIQHSWIATSECNLKGWAPLLPVFGSV